MVRTKHQRRNQHQRRKLAHSVRYDAVRDEKNMFFKSVDFFTEGLKRMMRTRSFHRGA